MPQKTILICTIFIACKWDVCKILSIMDYWAIMSHLKRHHGTCLKTIWLQLINTWVFYCILYALSKTTLNHENKTNSFLNRNYEHIVKTHQNTPVHGQNQVSDEVKFQVVGNNLISMTELWPFLEVPNLNFFAAKFGILASPHTQGLLVNK